MNGALKQILAVALAALLCAPAAAAERQTLERRIYRCFVEGAYEQAARLIEQFLEASPHDPGMLYNAACVYSRLGELDRSVTFLVRAVESGLAETDRIATDPDLEAVRAHPGYRSAMDRLQKNALGRSVEAIDQWRAVYGDDAYRYDRDETRRIAYATALDATSHRQMRQTIEAEIDHLNESLFAPSTAGHLLIAVPTPPDARRLFPDEATGGIYEHEKRRLIARDIGSSLRHELVHAAHYAHMEQLGQRHPLWVQEGLATLYEDYVFSDDGSIKFLPNDRDSVVRGLAAGGALTPWKVLLTMTPEAFMASAPRFYPQVRSIFQFLAESGKLSCWYDALIEHYDEDPTGSLAFVECFDAALPAVERQWRSWVAARPAHDTTIDPGDAALGIEADLNGSNDGVLITRILPRSSAAGSDLRIGDVVVAVDGRPTRSLSELRTIIAARSVGEEVTVRARRNGDYFTVIVSLRPLRPMNW